VIRSAGKYGVEAPAIDVSDNREAKTPLPEDDPELEPEDDPEIHGNGGPEVKPTPEDDENLDEDLDEDLDEELDEGPPPEIGMSSNILCAKVFEPPNYVVPGYIVEGLTLLAGKPKSGKSWMMLDVGLAVARGAFTFGDVYCAPGDVLYCALEDNKRRLQRRLNKLLNGQPAPKRLRLLSAGEMPLMSAGCLDMIQTWIEQVETPKLVVIDVLAKVRDRRQKDQGLYDADYAAMQGLKAIADEYGIAIVVIHHLRKMDADDPLDQVSGTTGLAGSADTVLVLNRTSTGTVLHGRGRDIEDVEKAMQFDHGTCRWTVLGNAGSVQYSGQRAAIVAVLKEAAAPMALADLAAASGMKANNARKLLLNLVRDGAVERAGRGKYVLAPEKE
jgi:hypothetical protein